MNNPFAGYGNIVYGENFIGRKAELLKIDERLYGQSFGNLAIVGLPRIGKSSLVWQGIASKKKFLVTKRIIPVWIDFANSGEIDNFFKILVKKCQKEIEENQFSNERIKKISKKILTSSIELLELYDEIQDYFKNLKSAGIRIIFILDEFDQVRKTFKNQIAGFQMLRELSYNPDWKVAIVTTSRRSLKEIETQVTEISNFALTFDDIYLSFFNEEDMQTFWDVYKKQNIYLREKYTRKIISFCGTHPYLLSMFSYHFFSSQNRSDSCEKNIKEVQNHIMGKFGDYYGSIIALLKENGLSEKLLQRLFGPVYDINQTDIENLLRYGLIFHEEKGFKTFSEHFNEYLQEMRRHFSIWSLWSEMETGFREIINSHLTDKYKDNWVDKLPKAQKKLATTINSMKEQYQREVHRENNSANLLDYSYPNDLFFIMQIEWKAFQDVFGNFNDCKPIFDFLASLRTPIAHNRNILSRDEINTAHGYCGLMIKKIEAWKNV